MDEGWCKKNGVLHHVSVGLESRVRANATRLREEIETVQREKGERKMYK